MRDEDLLERIDSHLRVLIALQMAQLRASGVDADAIAQLIPSLDRAGITQTEIAGLLGVNKSTVSRRLSAQRTASGEPD